MFARSLLAAALSLATFSSAQAQTEAPMAPTADSYRARTVKLKVPAGNRNERILGYPESTLQRLTRSGSLEDSVRDRYRGTIRTLSRRPEVFAMINRIAPLYGPQPIHVLGAIVGEHTFNVGIMDDIQGYMLVMHTRWMQSYESSENKVVEVLDAPEVKVCEEQASRYDYWNCIAFVWNRDFRGKTIRGTRYPTSSFLMTYFNPMGVGKTYGLGQMSPLRALMVTDIVNRASGRPTLDARDMAKVYEAILDVETSIHYISANLAVGVRLYHQVANFDLTDNPGVTATLYNLGNERARADQLFHANVRNLREGKSIQLPQENYYGWLINDRRAELEALLARHAN